MHLSKGFTIIELVVVIGIISVLSMLGYSSYESIQQDARNAKRKADLNQIKSALESYKLEHSGRYPTTSGQWSGLCNVNEWGPGGEDGLTTSGGPGVGYIADLAPTYIDELPVDPRNNQANPSAMSTGCQTTAASNCYLYRSNGTDYKLLAHCTPEGNLNTEDEFFDPCRPQWAWQISSSGTVRGTLNAAGTGCSGTGW